MSIESKMRELEQYIRNKIDDAKLKEDAYKYTNKYESADKFKGMKIAYTDIYERLFGPINISS
jgi:hypothetical protein